MNEHDKDTADKFELATFANFKYNTITKLLNANISKGASVHFSPALCAMLGMHGLQNPIVNKTEEPVPWKALNACDINTGFSSMYVYCNVLEHIPVGHTKAPLLRIVQLSGKSGDIVHAIYEKPLYVPLQQKNFDSMEIDIRCDIGKPIPFEHGKVIVTLHFRHCKIPYTCISPTMKRQFCCDASRFAYEDYYLKQSGSGMPVFKGARMQRGHGLGSILSGFFRSAWPLIQTGAKAFGKRVLRTGLQIANDVAEGQNFKESTLRCIPEGVKEFLSSNNFSSQGGSGGKRRKTPINRKIKKHKKAILGKHDIFGMYGVCSSTVLQMYKKRVGSLYSSSYADKYRDWYICRI